MIILIDEYDVPLENAYFEGFYGEMIGFIRSVFESALKTNPCLEFAVITGCLRITKESIFTGLNNLEMISILSRSYGEFFGFTQNEVNEMLKYYDITHRLDQIKEWYDGYLFGDTKVYNPWSVMNHVKALTVADDEMPAPYWANTSSNNIVKTLIEQADLSAKKELEDLLAGGVIEKPVHEDITYDSVCESGDSLWNFLFFTGYLKQVSRRMEQENQYITMAIPNLEVKYIYQNSIMKWFHDKIKHRDLTVMYQSIQSGDALTFQRELAALLADTFKGLEASCCRALTQIREREYDSWLPEEGYTDVWNYGISFFRKQCRIKAEHRSFE